MPRTRQQMVDDARRIWMSAVDAVRPEHFIPHYVRVEDGALLLGDERFALDSIDRLIVVGAGKAGASMALALEKALGADTCQAKQLTGWVNVPADCVVELQFIYLHAARPAAINEPTPEGVIGSDEIMNLVATAEPRDLVIALISGGGSALLPAPAAGVSLADKLAVTRSLSAAGASIQELNTVRKQLSRVKGGGLARACRANRLVALILSDVVGDPLDLIASGPTVVDRSTPAHAIDIIERYEVEPPEVAAKLIAFLKSKSPRAGDSGRCQVTNVLVANCALAVDAAGQTAEQLGYSHAMWVARTAEGLAEEVGGKLAALARQMRNQDGPDCLISGGEPVVRLCPPDERGKGGRNQQLVLAALDELSGNARGIVLLSGGTDGEDGPTDAAGAWLDEELAREAAKRGMEIDEFLHRNDAYNFFGPLGYLFTTGPTGTNVGDIRVLIVDRK